MKKLILKLMLFFPILCFGQDISGKWCAQYSSANGDGNFTDCFIIKKEFNSYEALRWIIAECRSCQNATDRKPRIFNMPSKTKWQTLSQILSALGLKYINGELMEEGGSPSGEDVFFQRDSKYIIKPSFNCSFAKQDREKAICSSSNLSFLDLELSLVFEAAKQCTNKVSLEKSQGSWWKEDLSKCQSGECVPRIYSERVAELRKLCK